MTDWLTNGLIDWLTDWFYDWLIDRSIDRIILGVISVIPPPSSEHCGEQGWWILRLGKYYTCRTFDVVKFNIILYFCFDYCNLFQIFSFRESGENQIEKADEVLQKVCWHAGFNVIYLKHSVLLNSKTCYLINIS